MAWGLATYGYTENLAKLREELIDKLKVEELEDEIKQERETLLNSMEKLLL